jgi:hypothetical protein
MRLHVLVRSAHHPEVDLKLNFTAADERREIAITIGESACLKITAIHWAFRCITSCVLAPVAYLLLIVSLYYRRGPQRLRRPRPPHGKHGCVGS